MKVIEYIQFASGWRPPTHRKIRIKPIKILRDSISKNGNPYDIWLGEISDEDAIILCLLDPHVKIINDVC